MNETAQFAAAIVATLAALFGAFGFLEYRLQRHHRALARRYQITRQKGK